MLLWTVSSSQLNPIVPRVWYGQIFAPYMILVPRVVRKHGLVQAWGPRLTVVFLTFSVLAQGGGGGGDSLSVYFFRLLAKGAWDRTFRFVISLDLFLAVHAVACVFSLSAITT